MLLDRVAIPADDLGVTNVSRHRVVAGNRQGSTTAATLLRLVLNEVEHQLPLLVIPLRLRNRAARDVASGVVVNLLGLPPVEPLEADPGA